MRSNDLLVFPTNRSIREYLNNKKSANQLLPKLITIGELFSRVVVPPSNTTLIDKDLRVLYLKLAIKDIQTETLGISKSFNKLYSQGDFIFKFFNELNSEFKSIKELSTIDTYGFYEEHLELLEQIYQNYSTLLLSKNLIDSIMLPKNFTINSQFLKDYTQIEIYYEGYFSSFEFKIINEIAKITTLIIHCTINKFNLKNVVLFQSIGFELELNNHYELNISTNMILKKNPLKKDFIHHTIYKLPSRLHQIAMIKYAIVSMVNNSGIDPSKIVLVLPDEKFAKYIKIFDNEKYFNFAMGNDISNSLLFKYAHAINNYFNIDEPKYTKRIEDLKINLEFLNNSIKVFWKKAIQKEKFFELIDFISLQEKDENILEKLFEIRLALENLLFSNLLFDEISLKDGFKIFLSKLSDISTDDIKAGKVTVMGILETRGMQYDGVIAIDFNDNSVPKKSIKDKFISSNVKKHANLPTPKDRENLQKYYYLKLFSGAKEVSIGYVLDKEHTPSRFLNELFSNPNIVELDFSQILKENHDISHTQNNIIQEINLSNLEWSATSLKVFLDCKRKFYFQYIQKINEHEISMKPKSYELGNIIHTILEKNYKNGHFSYKETLKEISKYQNINPYLTVELELWKKKLNLFFQNEAKRFENGVSVYELEKPFHIKLNGVTLKGKIDRIDKLQDGSFAILDYKTSSSLKVDTFKTYENSSDFQLIFYFLATKELGISQIGYYDLNDGKIKEEITLEPKMKRLFEILESFKTQFVNFEQCDKEQTCSYCPYKIICNKG